MRSELKKLLSQAGSSMIEVLVSVLIFSVGILGLVGLQAASMANSMNAEDRTQASILANELISTMQLKGTTSIPQSDIEAWRARVTSKLSSATAEVQVDATNLVTITLTWKAPSKQSTEASNQYQTQVMVL